MKMNKNSEKLLEEAKKVNLSEKDKNSIRQFLYSFIEKNPVREDSAVRLQNTKPETPVVEQSSLRGKEAWSENKSNKAGIFFLPRFLLRPMPIILIAALMIGGGVSLAAENALPGDALYSMKLNVNEEVMTFFAFSGEAKAKAEVKKAERRLEEAVQLALESRLDAQASASVEANFEKSAQKAEERIERLEGKGNAKAALEVSSDLEAALKAHSQIFGQLTGAAGADANAQVIGPIKTRVDLKLMEVQERKENFESQVRAEGGVEVEVAAQGRLTAATNKIAEVRAFIQKMEARLGAQATAEAEARLEVAESTLAQGEAKLDAEAFGEAFVLFQEAHQIAQEAKLLVEANAEIELKIKGGLNIQLFGSPTQSPSASPSPTATPTPSPTPTPTLKIEVPIPLY